jgi:uncharacterized iron-regulated protein
MHRRSFVRALGLAAGAALVAPFPGRGVHAAAPTQVQWRSPLLRDHALVGRVWDATSQRYASFDALIECLQRADFRLVGEVHDNADHHAIQAKLLEALGATRKPLVAFEQFDRELDGALQARMARTNATAADVADAVKFDRKGWNWDFYEPLVAIALRNGMRLRAANLSRAAAARIAKQGAAALEPALAAILSDERGWGAEREQALRDIIREGHCGALPESAVPRMATAQRARDATLAQSLLDAGRDGAVLIAGNGHVRRDLGVPVYLHALAPGRTSCAVGILEVEAAMQDPRAYTTGAADAQAPRYDFAIFTPRTDRPDPCAAFSTR